MEKTPFVTLEKIQEITKTYPTPFHLYDERGIRENVKRLKAAFAWNKGYKEYFAVKATPNPFILNILKEYGCGTDCSSMTELMMSDACGFSGKDIMFSSNDTPPEEFAFAEKLGAIINLDDITHIECLEQTLGYIPETISCRYNPGGIFKISNGIMACPPFYKVSCPSWAGGSSSSRWGGGGRSSMEASWKHLRKFSVVPYSKGRPGSSKRPRSSNKSFCIKLLMTPEQSTPRTCSTKALVTGWL